MVIWATLGYFQLPLATLGNFQVIVPLSRLVLVILIFIFVITNSKQEILKKHCRAISQATLFGPLWATLGHSCPLRKRCLIWPKPSNKTWMAQSGPRFRSFIIGQYGPLRAALGQSGPDTPCETRMAKSGLKRLKFRSFKVLTNKWHKPLLLVSHSFVS